jgi:hypothetical protein
MLLMEGVAWSCYPYYGRMRASIFIKEKIIFG